MCMPMGGGTPSFTPPPPPPPPPPPAPSSAATATATTVKQAAADSPFAIKPARKKNPFRVDTSATYDSGAPDSVATGLNIPV